MVQREVVMRMETGKTLVRPAKAAIGALEVVRRHRPLIIPSIQRSSALSDQRASAQRWCWSELRAFPLHVAECPALP